MDLDLSKITGISPLGDYLELKNKCRHYYKVMTNPTVIKNHKTYHSIRDCLDSWDEIKNGF